MMVLSQYRLLHITVVGLHVALVICSLCLVASAAGPERYARHQDETESLGEEAWDGGGGEEDVQADTARRNRGRRGTTTRIPLQRRDDDKEDDDDYYAETTIIHHAEQQGRGQGEDEEEEEEDYTDDLYYPNMTYATGGNCSHCPNIDRIQEIKLQLLKKKILRKLRLKKPPKRPPGDLPQFLNHPNLDTSEPATEPSGSYDEDDSVTRKIFIMGRRRKYFKCT